jgi:Trk K+ transport system NAD-binding subunit
MKRPTSWPGSPASSTSSTSTSTSSRRVPDDSRAAGHTIEEIAKESGFPSDCVIVGIFRPETGEFIIPRGHVGVEAGDRVYLAAHSEAVRRAAHYIGVK